MYLDQIVITKQQEVAELKQSVTLAELERAIAGMAPCRGFERALSIGKKRPMGLIAEVKKASPSKGLIRADFHPALLAKAYEEAGADCLSVLTDVQYFQGSNEYLKEVRVAVKLPLLRKDFVIDPLQIYEARSIGADAVLLIAAILTKQQLRDYHQIAKDIGLDVLLEVHDREELDRVLELQPTMVGVNNRNLKTFITDIQNTKDLIKHIPAGVTVVSESGISKAEEIEWLLSVGAHAVLVGEQFMRQPVIGDAVNELMGPVAKPGPAASKE